MAKPSKALGRLTKQEVNHNGFVYDLTEVIDYAEENGVKLKAAFQAIYPKTPLPTVTAIMPKINKHPYVLARKDASLALLKRKGPDLQQNMLDLAFKSRSEMVRYNATKDGLDRVYGQAEDPNAGEKAPTLVFNFNMSSGQAPDVRKVIDGETSD